MNHYQAAQRMEINLQLHDFIVLFVIIAALYITAQIIMNGGVKNAIKQLRLNLRAHMRIKRAKNKHRIKAIRKVVKAFQN